MLFSCFISTCSLLCTGFYKLSDRKLKLNSRVRPKSSARMKSCPQTCACVRLSAAIHHAAARLLSQIFPRSAHLSRPICLNGMPVTAEQIVRVFSRCLVSIRGSAVAVTQWNFSIFSFLMTSQHRHFTACPPAQLTAYILF